LNGGPADEQLSRPRYGRYRERPPASDHDLPDHTPVDIPYVTGGIYAICQLARTPR